MDKLVHFLSHLSSSVWDHFTHVVILVLVIFFFLKLIQLVSKHILKIASGKKAGPGGKERERRIATVVLLVQTALRVVLLGAALMMLLKEFGIDIAPLLTGAGIVGLALGLGAQSVVRDIISGTLLLLENQIRVGDVVKVGTLAGEVERMDLRSTAIRDGEGVLHIIPNGEIKTVSNMTFGWGKAVVEFYLPYSADLNKIDPLMEKVVNDLYSHPQLKENLLGKPEYLGITEFRAMDIKLELVAKTDAFGRWIVARTARRMIQESLQKSGVKLLN